MCGEDASSAMPVRREMNICLKSGWAAHPCQFTGTKSRTHQCTESVYCRPTLLSMCKGFCAQDIDGETGSVLPDNLFLNLPCSELGTYRSF